MAKFNTISFDGVDLGDICSQLRIIDVTISAPDVQPTTINPALRDGAIFARSTLSARTVTISYVIMDDDTIDRGAAIREISRWAKPSEVCRLIIPQEPNGYLKASCTKLPNNSAKEYWTPDQIVFTCYDPYFYGYRENYSEIGTTFLIHKWDNPDWRIEFDVGTRLEMPAWQHDSEQISFSTLMPGHLVIEKATQTAYLDDRSTLPTMMLGSRFFKLNHGDNLIQTSHGAGGVIYWRERWL